MPKQAETDGTIVDGPDAPHPTVTERDAIVRQALATRGWKVDSFKTVPQGGHFSKISAAVSRGVRQYELEIYVFLNLAWRNRDHSEKGIQITRPYSEHSDDFQLDNDGPKRCLLLGIYRRGGNIVFCGWPVSTYQGHASPTTCYVSVAAIADAFRSGFGQYQDSHGRLICCFSPDFFYYYAENIAALHRKVGVQQLTVATVSSSDHVTSQPAQHYVAANPVPKEVPRNRVLYGAPGTGKSHLLNEEAEKYFPSESLRKRITFYPEYTHAQFVGSYRPTPIYRDSPVDLYDSDQFTSLAQNKEPLIDYKFVPGPLLELYSKAKLNPSQNYVLIIEELNRADAAAVFGELFQLLDRDKSGESQFSISLPRDAAAYVRTSGIEEASARFPSNLFIWATMNSADQGVLPLDAAFKRRWVFEYVHIDRFATVADSWSISLSFLSAPIPWNFFRATVNSRLKALGIPEDRLLGPFFLRAHELADKDVFKNKLLLYLRDDVVRHEPDALFKLSTFGDIADQYDKGENVFRDLFVS